MTADDQMATPQLSVIVVSYNVRELLRACLSSLRAASAELRLQTLVVDNASADGTASRRRPFPEIGP